MSPQQVADEQFEFGDIPMEGNLELTEDEFRLYVRQHHRIESDNLLPNALNYLHRNVLLLLYAFGRALAASRRRERKPDSEE